MHTPAYGSSTLRKIGKVAINNVTTERMAKKLFVGNVDWGTTSEELGELFSQHGQIEEAVIIKNRETGRSKGFGFVTFINDEDAEKAIEALNGYERNGRALVVNEARPKEEA